MSGDNDYADAPTPKKSPPQLDARQIREQSSARFKLSRLPTEERWRLLDRLEAKHKHGEALNHIEQAQLDRLQEWERQQADDDDDESEPKEE